MTLSNLTPNSLNSFGFVYMYLYLLFIICACILFISYIYYIIYFICFISTEHLLLLFRDFREAKTKEVKGCKHQFLKIYSDADEYIYFGLMNHLTSILNIKRTNICTIISSLLFQTNC